MADRTLPNHRKDTDMAVVSPAKPAVAALAKAQSEMEAVLKNTDNSHFKTKYADLAAVMAACRPALNANGFAVMQPIGRDEVGAFVDTVLAHETGEEFRCRVYLMMAQNNMQGFGSAVSYARRYGLLAMAGAAPENDDDDGNAASGRGDNRREEPRRDTNSAAPPLRERKLSEQAKAPLAPSTPNATFDAMMEALKGVTSRKRLNRILTDPNFERDAAYLQHAFPDLYAKIDEEIERITLAYPGEAVVPFPPSLQEAVDEALVGAGPDEGDRNIPGAFGT